MKVALLKREDQPCFVSSAQAEDQIIVGGFSQTRLRSNRSVEIPVEELKASVNPSDDCSQIKTFGKSRWSGVISALKEALDDERSTTRRSCSERD